MYIRREEPQDYDAIYALNEEAFGRDGEAKLVNALREAGALYMSLVALGDRNVLGHIAFSPVTIEPASEDVKASCAEIKAVGLAPMSVLPSSQKKGIGYKMVTGAIEVCKKQKLHLIFVLGHPGYYSRYGFQRASKHGLTPELPAPDEAFMVKELQKGSLEKAKGTIKYHPAFNALS